MRKPYPSDLTDEQWALIEPLIPVQTVGRPRTNAMREVLNAIFHLNRSGCQWYTHTSEPMIRVSSIHRMLRLLKPDQSRKPAPFKYRELQGKITG